MWTWTLNWSEITPTILVGSCPMTPADLKTIQPRAYQLYEEGAQGDALDHWNQAEAELWRTAILSRGAELVPAPDLD